MLRIFNCAIGAALLLASVAGSTAAEAADYNVLTFKNFTGVASDVEGALAAGGDINVATVVDWQGGYTIGEKLSATGDYTVVAGKSFTANNGDLKHGNIAVGTTASIAPNVFNLNGGSVTVGTQIIDFAATEAAYKTYSATLGSYQPTGETRLEAWGGLFLTGTNSGLNVFNVGTSAVLHGLNLSIPTGATALINWSGTPAAFTNFEPQGSFGTGNVLFNFTDATALTINGFNFKASAIAPYADVAFWNGQFNGQLIANSVKGGSELWQSSGQFNMVKADPGLGIPPPVPYSASSTPEASTWLMLVTGFGLIGATARRRSSPGKTAMTLAA